MKSYKFIKLHSLLPTEDSIAFSRAVPHFVLWPTQPPTLRGTINE